MPPGRRQVVSRRETNVVSLKETGCLPEGDRLVSRRETKVASGRETVWSPRGRQMLSP